MLIKGNSLATKGHIQVSIKDFCPFHCLLLLPEKRE